MNKPGFAALQQASQWYAVLGDLAPDHEQRQRWRRWLDESEENRRAWQYVQTVSQRFQPLRDSPPQPVMQALRHQSADTDRRRALKLGALLSAGALLSWATYRHTPLRDSLLTISADQRSAVGEIRTLTLPDHSRLWLNTASAVDIRYPPQHRQVILRAGDILIDTAADPRPFFVSTQQGQMQALGTRFSVRQYPDSTSLAVYQGAVEISARHSAQKRRVNAGQQLRFDDRGQGDIVANQATDAGWSRGLLQANNLPLGEVIAQLARYRRGYLACQPEIAALRVMGTFPLTDTDTALTMLANAFPIRIQRRFSWWVTVEAQ